jgi:hypothetical protein
MAVIPPAVYGKTRRPCHQVCRQTGFRDRYFGCVRWGDDRFPHSVQKNLLLVMQPNLLHKVVAMRFNGVGTPVHDGRGFLVGFSFRQKLHDLIGERARPWSRRSPRMLRRGTLAGPTGARRRGQVLLRTTSEHQGAIHNISHNLSLRIFTIGSDTSPGPGTSPRLAAKEN